MNNRIVAALIAGALAIAFAGCGGGGGGGGPAPPGGVGGGTTRTITGVVIAKAIDDPSRATRAVQGVTIKLGSVSAVTGADGRFSLTVSTTSDLAVQFQVQVDKASGTFPAVYNELVTYSNGHTYNSEAVDVPKDVLNEETSDLGTIQITEVVTSDPPPAPPVHPDHDMMVYGRVVRSDGSGLEGVHVNIGQLTTALDTTGKKGYFAANLGANSVLDYYSASGAHAFKIDTTGAGVASNTSVTYNGTNYLQSSINLSDTNFTDLLNGLSTDLGRVTLVDVSSSLVITGRIVSQASGQGISGYHVLFGANDDVTTQTDSTGNFRLVLGTGRTAATLYPAGSGLFKVYRTIPDPNAPPPFPVNVQFRGVSYTNDSIEVPSDIMNGASVILGDITVDDT